MRRKCTFHRFDRTDKWRSHIFRLQLVVLETNIFKVSFLTTLTWQWDWLRQVTSFLHTNVPFRIDLLIIGAVALVDGTEEVKRTTDTTGITTGAHWKARQILVIKVAVLLSRLVCESKVFIIPRHIGNSFHVVLHFFHNRSF